MSNSYFRFKKFTIQQDRCAMKVCTDSCILGAWTALRVPGVKKILDIGTGTALLPLMLAQKSDARIDTIEWDPETCAQASENIQESPWSDRIHLLEGDARIYNYPGDYEYMIINPPFFESDLRSPELKKNKAKHEESLTLDELVSVIKYNLRSDGGFSILLPYHRTEYFGMLASSTGFFLQEKLTIRQTPAHAPFRTICQYGFKKPEHAFSKELTIKNEAGKYSLEFIALMKDYYC